MKKDNASSVETPSPTPATVSQIAAEVKRGLRAARDASDDTELDKVIDDLEKTWDVVCERFILVAVGLTAFNYRNKTQIIKQLENYKTAVQNGQHAALFTKDFEGKVC